MNIFNAMFNYVKLFVSTVSGSSSSNFILNERRLGLICRLFLRYAELTLFKISSSLTMQIPQLISALMALFRDSADRFSSTTYHLYTWLIRYVTTGKSDQGDLPSDLWISSSARPVLIGSIIFDTLKNVDLSSRALVLSFLLSLLSIHRLTLWFVATIAVAMLTNSSSNPSESAATIFTNFIGHINVVPTNLMSDIKDSATNTSGLVVKGIGPNGPLLWTATADARAIKKDESFAMYKEFCKEVGCSNLEHSIDTAAKLPLLRSLSTCLQSFSYLLVTTIARGSFIQVVVNYWLLVPLKAFSDHLSAIVSGLTGYVSSYSKSLNDSLKKRTSDGKESTMSFNVVNGMQIPWSVITEFINLIFGSTRLGSYIQSLYSPASVKPYKGGPDHPTNGIVLTQLSFFRLIFILITYAFIVEAANTNDIKLTSSNIMFNQSGDFVIFGDDLIAAVLSLFSKFGITVQHIYCPSGQPNGQSVTFFGKVWSSGFNVTGLSIHSVCAFVNFNYLAWLLQNEGTESDWFTKDNQFWTFIEPLTNKTDLRFLLLLNAMPTELSGIHTPLLPSTQIKSGGASLVEGSMKTNDLVTLGLFVNASALLSSLDNMTRLPSSLSQFLLMTAAKAKDDRYVSEDGVQHPISAASSPEFIAETHPMLWAINTILPSAIGSVYSSLADSGKDATFDSMVPLFEYRALISFISVGSVEMGWLTLHRSLFTTMLDLLDTIRSRPDRLPLTNVVKLQGYGHPFNLTYNLGSGVSISTTPFVSTKSSLPTSLDLGRAIHLFDPYNV